MDTHLRSIKYEIKDRWFVDLLLHHKLVSPAIENKGCWFNDRLCLGTLEKIGFYNTPINYTGGTRKCSPDLRSLNLYATVRLPAREGCVGRVKSLAYNAQNWHEVELEFDDVVAGYVWVNGVKEPRYKSVFFESYSVHLVDVTQCKYVYKTKSKKPTTDLPPMKNKFGQKLMPGDFVIGSISTTRGIFVAGTVERRTPKQLYIKPYPGIVPDCELPTSGLMATQYPSELLKISKDEIEQHLFKAVLGS